MGAALQSSDELETPRRRRQLHGRRVGRALTEDAERLLTCHLPSLRLDLAGPPPQPLASLFASRVETVWLEIGFGGGEHLLWQAEANPYAGIIGCEPFLSGVAKVCRGIEEAGLTNLRLYDDDARHVLEWLPDASISRVFVLFPDPWPKKRHRKRRLLGDAGLRALSRVMSKGAELRFATDIEDYAAMVLAAIDQRQDFASVPGEYPERPADWPLTRYAEKAMASGRRCRFFGFQRL